MLAGVSSNGQFKHPHNFLASGGFQLISLWLVVGERSLTKINELGPGFVS